MKRLEVSGAVRPIYGSLGVKRLISSGSKKKETRYACLSEAKASHSQRMWAQVSSLAAHLLHNGMSSSPSTWRCLLRVLCPVRRPVTTLGNLRLLCVFLILYG